MMLVPPVRLRGLPRPIVELGTVLVLLLLSWQLVVVKRTNARMQREIDQSTRAFVVGDSLPALQLRMTDGRRMVLPQFCDRNRQLIVVASSPACGDCIKLSSEWRTLVGRPDLAVLLVETGPGAGAPIAAPGLLHATAEADGIIGSLRIREVPAVLLGGSDCRIRAAGAGLTASRSVLAVVGEPVRASAAAPIDPETP